MSSQKPHPFYCFGHLTFLAMISALMLSGCAIGSSGGEVNAFSSRLGVGDSAHSLLSDADFDALVVEIQAVQGFEPHPTSLNHLQGFLEARLKKPGGIGIAVNPSIDSPGKSAYSIRDVESIEERTRKHFAAERTITAYFLFLDGASTKDSGNYRILGHAYRNTSMVLYAKSIRDLTGGIGQPSRRTVESAVLLHEFGHILGLVNVGTPPTSPHHDHANGAHCTNQDCLMYYAVNTSDFLANLLGGDVPSLDEACVSDLQANGGR